VIGNDERQFNGPGVRVPMLSLSRVLPPEHPDWPYPEYHSDHDDLSVCSVARLEESAAITLRMLDAAERNWRPVNLFKGEAFCSRYGLHIDWQVNPEGSRALFHIMDRIDGSRTVADIARECGVPFSAVVETLKEMERCGLVSLAR
jgi:aminopeptidase-like protein